MKSKAIVSSMLTAAAVSVGLFMVGPSYAVTDAQFNEANQAFQRAGAGDKSAVSDAVDKFDQLLKSEPTNPILVVYLGAATSMQARTTILPWKKISFAEDGMALEDKALVMLTQDHDTQLQNGVPISLSVRYVTANTFLSVPGFFNRGARGEKLLNEVLESPMFEKAPLHFQGGVWMRAARFAQDQKRLGDAKKYLDLVIKANAPQVDAAKVMMAAL